MPTKKRIIMKLFKIVLMIASIAMAHEAFGFSNSRYCFNVVNNSDYELVEAWADLDRKGCSDLHVNPKNDWGSCSTCDGQSLESPKLTIKGRPEVQYYIPGNRIEGNMTLTVYPDHVVVQYTDPDRENHSREYELNGKWKSGY
jgi:hypothetical protein